MAIVHIAMADVVSAITGSFDSYTNVTANPGAISQEIAIAQGGARHARRALPLASAEFWSGVAGGFAR